MLFKICRINYLVAILLTLFALISKAAPPIKKARNIKPTRPKISSVQKDFEKSQEDYHRGRLSKQGIWEKSANYIEQASQFDQKGRLDLLQMQSKLLYEAGYPIIAAIYASQALRLEKDPTNETVVISWNILEKTSQKKSIQNLLEAAATKIPLKNKTAPEFGRNWNYFVGNAMARDKKIADALYHYNILEPSDRYYLLAKYQQAMLFVEENRLNEAIAALKTILAQNTSSYYAIGKSARQKIIDYTYLALGRIYYEQQDFPAAIKMFRTVERQGNNFYNALFEQSWAFFMAGHPMHALGALYAVESPFYQETFNPEAPIVRALINYWLCRYEDSRAALADFAEKYGNPVDKLDDFMQHRKMTSDTAFSLFENLLKGVSQDSLGVPLSILKTAAEKDSMLQIRDQYAGVLEEKIKLEKKGVFGSPMGLTQPLEYIDRWANALRNDLGQKFLTELTEMRTEYERLFSQAEFLYVELLMSEKEQILGKQLHADSKINQVSKKQKIAGWAQNTQAWKASKIGEYWWDEIGYYIMPVDSQCHDR